MTTTFIVLGILVALVVLLLAVDWLSSGRLKKRLRAGGSAPTPQDPSADKNINYDGISAHAQQVRDTNSGIF
ncbi:MAG TPA: hypothetical protein VFM09_11135 [Marmoricola sp.]|nr:hypothetical protein [Marmoricola sp.]